jgi:hypothetical protein
MRQHKGNTWKWDTDTPVHHKVLADEFAVMAVNGEGKQPSTCARGRVGDTPWVIRAVPRRRIARNVVDHRERSRSAEVMRMSLRPQLRGGPVTVLRT